jgi:hypothetical protein
LEPTGHHSASAPSRRRLRLQAKSCASNTGNTWRHCWSFADILQHSTALSGTHLGEVCLLLAEMTLLFLVWDLLRANKLRRCVWVQRVYLDMESRKQKLLLRARTKMHNNMANRSIQDPGIIQPTLNQKPKMSLYGSIWQYMTSPDSPKNAKAPHQSFVTADTPVTPHSRASPHDSSPA